MKTIFLFLFALLQILFVQAQSFSNLGFEYWQRNSFPLFWQHPGITVCADSIIKLSGRYSLKAMRYGVDAEKNKSGYGLILQHIGTAFRYSDVQHKKIEVSVQIKSRFTDSLAYASAFVQIIDAQHPQNNDIAIGNNVAGDDWKESSTSITVPEIGAGAVVYMGVIMTGQGEMWLDDYKIKVDNQVSKEVSPKVTDLTVNEKRWLSSHIIPISNESLTDKELFSKAITETLIVGIGDNVHGSSSVIRLKNMFSKILIADLDYTLLAIEDSPSVGESLNRYVLGEADVLDRGSMNVMYANADFINFIGRLRQYNKTVSRKVRIFGVDVNGRYEALIHYINKETDKKYSLQLDSINHIFKLRLKGWKTKGYEKIPFNEEDKNYFRANLGLIKKDISQMNISEDKKMLLDYYICNLFNYLEFDRKEREKMMAENIKWLFSHYQNEKVIYLAHNTHVGNCFWGTKSCGAWLKETYKDKYYMVGTCYFTGTDSYKKRALYNSEEVINESVKGSYEYLFNQIDDDGFFLDLKQIGAHYNSLDKWLTVPMLMRNYGVEPFNYYHEFSLVDIINQYDGIMFVKNSVPL